MRVVGAVGAWGGVGRRGEECERRVRNGGVAGVGCGIRAGGWGDESAVRVVAAGVVGMGRVVGVGKVVGLVRAARVWAFKTYSPDREEWWEWRGSGGGGRRGEECGRRSGGVARVGCGIRAGGEGLRSGGVVEWRGWCGVNKGRRAELLEITDGKVTQSLH